MENSISKKIELALEQKGLSMAALGRKLGGISGQRIGMYVNGTRKPKQDFFDKWEKAFGYKIESADKVETNVVSEPEEKYTLLKQFNDLQKDYLESLKAENSYLKEENKKMLSVLVGGGKIQSR